MKKKYLLTMLAAMTAVALSVTACVSAEETVESEATVASSVEGSIEASMESTEVVDPATYEACITSLSDDEAMGYTADGILYLFDLTGVSDEEKALFVEDAVLAITDDGSELTETTISVDGEEQTAIVVVATAVVSVDEELATEIKAEMYASVYGYTVEEQESTTKYVNQAMTVYVGADETADEVGTLAASDEVTVTGVTDNGYTQIEYNGETAYVDSEAIVDEKPEIQEDTSNGSSTNTGSSSTDGGSNSTTTTTTSGVPKEITVDGKTLSRAITLKLVEDLAGLGVTVDTNQYHYRYIEGTNVYYYQFTSDEIADTSTITDLESHLIAVKTY